MSPGFVQIGLFEFTPLCVAETNLDKPLAQYGDGLVRPMVNGDGKIILIRCALETSVRDRC